MQVLSATQENKIWKNLFLLFSVLIIIVMPLLSHCYGQSGDEWLQMQYGEHIFNYFFNGDKQALDYSNMSLQYQGIEFYGGLFDYAMFLLHKLIPVVNIVLLRHFFNALTGAFLMIFTGLLAFRISKKWSVAFIALLFIIFSPRIFGESMNNPKDIPFAFGFVMGIYYFIGLLENISGKRWKYAIGTGLGFAISFGVRPAGGLMHIGYFVVITLLYYFTNKEFKTVLKANKSKFLKQAAIALIVCLAGGYFIGLLAWPWGLQAPFSRPIESLKQMTNIRIPIRVLYDGAVHYNNAMPWHYEFKWIIISSPLIVMLCTLLFIVFFSRAKKTYGIFVPIVLIFCAFFPPLYMIAKKSSVHDSWRHLFFVYPFWVIMAALTVDIISEMIAPVKWKKIPHIVAIIGLLPAIIWTFYSHPNQYVYFNQLVGGLKGAYGYYETDYYQNTNKQAACYIMEHAAHIQGRKVLVRSNMGAITNYLGKDTSWIESDYGRYNERHEKGWDYFIAYSRYLSPELLQNDIWPPKDAWHVIKVDDVPLCVILKRKSTAGIEAAKAYGAKDYAVAAQKYEQFVLAEPYDEMALVNYGISLASIGKMDDAIAALNRATELDPTRPEFYQIIAQIYQAKGDNAHAQEANNKAQSLIMQEQEAAGDETE